MPARPVFNRIVSLARQPGRRSLRRAGLILVECTSRGTTWNRARSKSSIEEFFGEFPRKKTAAEIVRRLSGRSHLILLASRVAPRRPRHRCPGLLQGLSRGFERRSPRPSSSIWSTACAATCSSTIEGCSTPGSAARAATGGDQGHFRALTEQREAWAIAQGFDEIVVKTKNKFYEMRGTLDHLRFEVVKCERHAGDNAESKVYSARSCTLKCWGPTGARRTVVQATLVKSREESMTRAAATARFSCPRPFAAPGQSAPVRSDQRDPHHAGTRLGRRVSSQGRRLHRQRPGRRVRVDLRRRQPGRSGEGAEAGRRNSTSRSIPRPSTNSSSRSTAIRPLSGLRSVVVGPSEGQSLTLTYRYVDVLRHAGRPVAVRRQPEHQGHRHITAPHGTFRQAAE